MNYISGKDADIRVVLWWIGLSLISILNFLLWTLSYLKYKDKIQNNSEYYKARKLYPILTLIYVIVCAFRSFLPRAYVARTVLVDSWWSNIFLARFGATFAEISFIILLALYAIEIYRNLGMKKGIFLIKITIPLIIIAQICVWANIITTNNLYAILEEFIWGIGGILLIIALIPLLPKIEVKWRKLIIFFCIFLVAYVAFLVVIDIPKYVIRYITDEASGKIYLSFSEGINDLLSRWVVSYEYADWVNEMAWLGLYFSTAVWLVIYLINAPEIKLK